MLLCAVYSGWGISETRTAGIAPLVPPGKSEELAERSQLPHSIVASLSPKLSIGKQGAYHLTESQNLLFRQSFDASGEE
jgi:hypothetical protein